MGATLVAPSTTWQASYVDALREGFRRGDQPAMTEAEILKVDRYFHGFIRTLTAKGGMVILPGGEAIPRVPGDTFWLVDGPVLIGEANTRYALNPWLIQIGGHVGYGIRPSLQRRGYGRLILKLALEKVREQGIRRALVTCYDHNVGSAKVIEANGGRLENLIDDPRGGGKSRRYWIDLAP